MGVEEALLLGRRQRGHAVDVVMAVALDMADAEQRHQRQVLLQGDAGLDRQVLGAHQVAAGRSRGSRGRSGRR